MDLTAPPAVAPRRILLGGLTEADARRLDVFLVVRSDRLRHAWQIVGEGPVDVYLHGADDAPTIPGSLDRPPHQVRVIDDARRADPEDLGVLCRPLQYEAFVNILAAVEQQMPRHAGPATGAATRAPESAPAAALPQAPAPVPAPAPGSMRYRLRRWPGAGLLDTIPQGVRMASFITVRYLTVDELSRLSGMEQEGCSRFLDTMMEADLLRAEPATAAVQTAVPAPAAAPRPDRALLGSLRAKLGLRTQGR